LGGNAGSVAVQANFPQAERTEEQQQQQQQKQQQQGVQQHEVDCENIANKLFYYFQVQFLAKFKMPFFLKKTP